MVRLPPYVIHRTDHMGRPISLPDTPPRGHSVLFTGRPGSGVTTELDLAEQFASDNGMLVFRVDASPREPLESRFSRAIGDQLPELREQFGWFELRKLRRLAKQMSGIRLSENVLGADLRLGWDPFQAGFKRETNEAVEMAPAGMVDLAETVSELVERRGSAPALLVIDNLETASNRDLAALNDLAAHLQRNGKPIYLACGGGDLAPTRLMNASQRLTSVEANIANLYDIRETRQLSDAEMLPSITHTLARRGIPYQPDAVQPLLDAAEGNPRRLAELVDAASTLAQPYVGVTAEVAHWAAYDVQQRSAVLYEAKWNNCTPAEKDLLARIADTGSAGLDFIEVARDATPARWAELDSARQSLSARGILVDGAPQMNIEDPGMRAWVSHHVSGSAATNSTDVPIGEASGEQDVPGNNDEPTPTGPVGPDVAAGVGVGTDDTLESKSGRVPGNAAENAKDPSRDSATGGRHAAATTQGPNGYQGSIPRRPADIVRQAGQPVSWDEVQEAVRRGLAPPVRTGDPARQQLGEAIKQRAIVIRRGAAARTGGRDQ